MSSFAFQEKMVDGLAKPIDVEKKLTSHVPDLVVFDSNSSKIPHILKFDGVLLFADVSGFTALTERYTMSSNKGTDALTVTLNNYIGKIVQKILQAGGDILKFAGDAILASWKVKSRSDLIHAISQAAKCSLVIQEKCDNQETDVGVKLRVKIAISAGKIFATFVGNAESRHFVMSGRPVREVNAAEKYCEAGLVVLSPNAMELSDKDNIIAETLPERFGLVKYLRREPRKEWQDYVDMPSDLRFTKHSFKSIRLALGIRPHDERESVIRKYVSPVVQRKLDDDQPLKYLSEMRQCSILFINLAFESNERDRLYHEKQSNNMQTAFSTVFYTVKERQGSLNKIFIFDKGCTFLVIFGLPGDKHEQEPAHALQAAWKISKALRNQLPSLMLVSAGVTTGSVFCGVIGHEERHEYTVIGQKVNLAARLMMHYPDMVSCDFETQNNSKLSEDSFSRLARKAMKGVGNVIVYEYTEGTRKPVGTTTILEPEYPIIGRETEIEIFMEVLRELQMSQLIGSERRIIVFEGEAGYGKTRVMKELQWKAACEGVRVVSFTLSINDQTTPFFAIKILLELLTGIEGVEEAAMKEEALLQLVSPEFSDCLFLLNDIICVNYPESTTKVLQMSQETQTKMLHELLVHIVEKVACDMFVLFALDDAQNVDNESWGLITTISKHHRSLCLVAMRPYGPDKPPCSAAQHVLYHPKTMYVKLGGLINEHITPLACQMLHVERIPLELEQLLVNRSYGVPLWCEQLIREMQTAGILLVIPISSKSKTSSFSSLVYRNDLARETSRHAPSVGVKDKCLITKRNTTLNDISTKNDHRNASRLNVNVEIKDEAVKQSKIQSHQNDDLTKTQKRSLPAWTNRVRWTKNSASDLLRQLSGGKENAITPLQSTESLLRQYVAMECITKPTFNLNQFPVPASIRGMALARLDRMKPFEQLIVKCAAVIGENTSRTMLKAVVPGCNEEKFKSAIFRLMYTRVFVCAAASLEAEKVKSENIQSTRRGMAHCVKCLCPTEKGHEDSPGEKSLSNAEKVAARCQQLKFHNSLVQETAYKLWLQEQRNSLHEACANYLEVKINEVLITGTTDNSVIEQLRLSRHSVGNQQFSSDKDSDALLEEQSGIVSELNNFQISHTSTVSPNSAHETTTQEEKPKEFINQPNANQRRVSRTSVIGRIQLESIGGRNSVCLPLILKDDALPKDFFEFHSADKQHSINTSAETSNPATSLETCHPAHIYVPEHGEKTEKMVSFQQNETFGTNARKMSYGPLWNQSIGLPQTYDKILCNTEEHAKRLSKLRVNSVFRTPYEVHQVLSLLYTHVVYHWKRALNTRKTIEFCLKSAESCNAILQLVPALKYLQKASEIIQNLDKGLDIVSNFTENDDLNLEDIKVLSVSRTTKAKVQSLLGQVLFQQGKLQDSLAHFYKALKILRSKLPSNRILILVNTWIERRRQSLHVKQPSKYIASASSELANKYVEQIRCLSYVWQILYSLKSTPNRLILSQLVALKQVNRAEAADDDLQELITSYTYMMQINQIAGNLAASAFYENKATARCLELPLKLSASDLYITGHLHLVSCSVRLCNGKMAYATTAGYRAYNVADSLGDVDIKLLVLPLLAQIHTFTGRGRACNEVLNLLLQVARHSADDAGIVSYFSLCMDLILDAGYSLEISSDCLEVMQNSESHNIEDALRFYVRSLMAVWCYRRNETYNGKAWLNLASKIVSGDFESFISAKAYVRFVEAQLLAMRDSQVSYGLKDNETQKITIICRKLLRKLCELCKSFPIFNPRYLHFYSYYLMLTDNQQKAIESIAKSINLAKYSGNSIDENWAEHSKKIWSNAKSKENIWVELSEAMPSWEQANQNDHINRCYSLLTVECLF